MRDLIFYATMGSLIIGALVGMVLVVWGTFMVIRDDIRDMKCDP